MQHALLQSNSHILRSLYFAITMVLTILFLALFFYIVIKNAIDKKKSKVNPYIEQHQKKMNDDKLYEEYLEFCKANGELPMEKSGFHELRMKEEKQRQKINDAFK